MGFRGGYADLQLDEEAFRVTYRGNGYTSSERVEKFLLFRCAELTVERDYDFFVIFNSKDESSQFAYTTPGSYSSTTNVVGSTAYTHGQYSPGTTIPITKHRATVIIKLFKGQKPDFPLVYNARMLIKNLRSQEEDLPMEGGPPINR